MRERILAALHINENPLSFTLENMDKNTLLTLAKKTNSAYIHCSGNCCVLAAAMLYNLKMGQSAISVSNTYPICQGTDDYIVHKIILNDKARFLTDTNNFNALAESLLSQFKKTGERVYIISALSQFRSISIGNATLQTPSSYHDLNAVIIGTRENPTLLFVDAWKTSHPVYTLDEIRKRYDESDLKLVASYKPGPVTPFEKPVVQSRFYSVLECG